MGTDGGTVASIGCPYCGYARFVSCPCTDCGYDPNRKEEIAVPVPVQAVVDTSDSMSNWIRKVSSVLNPYNIDVSIEPKFAGFVIVVIDKDRKVQKDWLIGDWFLYDPAIFAKSVLEYCQQKRNVP